MINFFTRHGKLRGKKIGVLAADGFEFVELSIPKKALWLAGATVDVVSLHPGKIRGMNLTEPTKTVRVDRTLEQVLPENYDALLIPGGFIGPDLLRQSRAARDYVRAFDEASLPIASLCHGPWLLASANLVRGRRLASWPGIRDDIVHAGGVWRNEAVVRDRNWVTSRGPQDLAQFIPAMIDLFANGATSQAAEQLPDDSQQSSPPSEQPLKLAVAGARLLPGPGMRALAGVAGLTAASAFALRRAG